MKLSFHQHIALFWMIGAPGVFAPVIENAKRPAAALSTIPALVWPDGCAVGAAAPGACRARPAPLLPDRFR